MERKEELPVLRHLMPNYTRLWEMGAKKIDEQMNKAKILATHTAYSLPVFASVPRDALNLSGGLRRRSTLI